MAVASAVRVAFESLRYLPADEFVNGLYIAVYTMEGAVPDPLTDSATPVENPVRMLKIKNFTDQNIFISFDGYRTVDIVATMSGEVDDYCSNQSGAGALLEFPAGSYIYVLGETAAPTKGTIYVTVIYADIA